MKRTSSILVLALVSIHCSRAQIPSPTDVVTEWSDAASDLRTVDVPVSPCPLEHIWIAFRSALGAQQGCVPLQGIGFEKSFYWGDDAGPRTCWLRSYNAVAGNSFFLDGAVRQHALIAWGFPERERGIRFIPNPFSPSGATTDAAFYIPALSNNPLCHEPTGCGWRSVCEIEIYGNGLIGSIATMRLARPCELPDYQDAGGTPIQLDEFIMQATIQRGTYLTMDSTLSSRDHTCP